MCIDFVVPKQVVGNHMTRTHIDCPVKLYRDAELIYNTIYIYMYSHANSVFSTIPSSVVLFFPFHSCLRVVSVYAQAILSVVCVCMCVQCDMLEKENRFIWSLELRFMS